VRIVKTRLINGVMGIACFLEIDVVAKKYGCIALFPPSWRSVCLISTKKNVQYKM
jgi:hypothetical protein